MGYQFKKMSGAGNDFIVIDNREGVVPVEGREALFAQWCARRTGIGADGVLLVEPPEGEADFRMRYHNADGGEVESCGNGARCIARFAHLVGAAGEQMRFETRAGLYEARIAPEAVTVSMSDPFDLREGIDLSVPGLFEGRVDFVNTGVPHVVMLVGDLEATPVNSLGSAIRHHELFRPDGTNANFASVRDAHHLDIRTYERGVEDETLACGTGAIAAVLIAHRHGLAQSPVAVTTRSGLVLTIHFEPTDTGWRTVRLEGEARVVYDGVVA